MTETVRYTATILDAPHAEHIDSATVWRQIGKWPLIRIGAAGADSTFVFAADYVQFHMRLGRAKRRVVIVLGTDDTYSIEVGQTIRKTFEFRTLAVRRGVHAAQLGETLEAMFVEAFA